MSRMNDIYKYRKELMETFQRGTYDSKAASLALIQSNLLEISDTLAMMYDKMYEGKDEENEK